MLAEQFAGAAGMLVSETHRDLKDGGERLRVASLLFQKTVNLLAGRGLGHQTIAKGLYGEVFLMGRDAIVFA